MRVIIIGPAQSGKTTLLHKIIRTNPGITFSIIIDGLQAIAGHQNILAGIPPASHFIVTSQTLDIIPDHVRTGALIIDVPTIRGV